MKMLICGIILAINLNAMADTVERTKAYESIQALTSATKTLNQADLNCNSSDDCTVLGLGDRSCGGVSEYMVSSLLNANIEEVKYLAERTQAKEAEYNTRFMVISICSIEIAPTVSCNAGTCQAQ